MVTYEAPVPIRFSVKTISLLRLRQKMAENGDGHPVVTSYNEDCIVAQSSWNSVRLQSETAKLGNIRLIVNLASWC